MKIATMAIKLFSFFALILFSVTILIITSRKEDEDLQQNILKQLEGVWNINVPSRFA